MDSALVISRVARLLSRLRRDTAGGLGVLVGVSLPVVVGSVGLAFDINRGLEQRIVNQRAADMAALGAAMAFKASNNEAVLQPTAIDLGKVNGIPGATVTATVVSNYPANGDKSVKVLVSSRVPFTLARVLGLTGNYSVNATSYASLVSQAQYAAPCFLALSTASDAFTTNGGATVNAPDCSIAAVGSADHKSNSIVAHDLIAGGGNVSVGTGSLSAQSVRFAGSFDVPQWNTAVPAASRRFNQATALSDPWANDAQLVSARSELGAYTAPAALSDPVITCSNPQNWSLDWNPNNSNPAKAFWTGSGYNIPAGTWCIKKLTAGGGLAIKFADNSTIYATQGFANGGGTTFNFGNSNVYVNGGFDTGSGGVTIGNGVLWIGTANGNAIRFAGTTVKGSGDVIVNGTLTLGGGQKLTMGAGRHLFGAIDMSGGGLASLGDGDFSAVAGVKIDGDSELALGAGAIAIGPGNGSNAIKMSGSARFFMGDGPFSANGSIDTAGGSRLVFGQTANHKINGSLKISGSVLFAPGRYTVAGQFWNGTGGTVWPYTSTLTGRTYGSTLSGVSVSGFDMAGVGVTFILGGAFDLAGGARTKFISAGTTSTGGAIADMIVDSLTTTNIDWTGGTTNVFDGTVHFPNAQVKMAGGNATSGSGECFTLIASKIWLTGGATAGTACEAMTVNAGSTTAASIRLLK